MRWAALAIPAIAAVAALLIVQAGLGPSESARDLPPGMEPAENVGWADPVAASFGRELDIRRRGILERSLAKSEIALSLARGELSLEEAADRFQALNANDPNALAPLRPVYPAATDAELVYRQVFLYVRGNHRQDPDRVTACLPVLEAEINRRFHSGRAIDRPARPGPAGEPVPAMGHVTAQTARVR